MVQCSCNSVICAKQPSYTKPYKLEYRAVILDDRSIGYTRGKGDFPQPLVLIDVFAKRFETLFGYFAERTLNSLRAV